MADSRHYVRHDVSYDGCICMHRGARRTFLASVRVESSSNLDANSSTYVSRCCCVKKAGPRANVACG